MTSDLVVPVVSCPNDADPGVPTRTVLGSREPHWITRTHFGVALLLQRLQWLEPSRSWSIHRAFKGEYQHALEAMVDDLGLRDWPAPTGLLATWRAGALLLLIDVRVSLGFGLPKWSFLHGRHGE